jgi:hypothetical protein
MIGKTEKEVAIGCTVLIIISLLSVFIVESISKEKVKTALYSQGYKNIQIGNKTYYMTNEYRQTSNPFKAIDKKRK